MHVLRHWNIRYFQLVSQYMYKYHECNCFIRFPNTEKWVENHRRVAWDQAPEENLRASDSARFARKFSSGAWSQATKLATLLISKTWKNIIRTKNIIIINYYYYIWKFEIWVNLHVKTWLPWEHQELWTNSCHIQISRGMNEQLQKHLASQSETPFLTHHW